MSDTTTDRRHTDVRIGQRIEYCADNPDEGEPRYGIVWALGPERGQAWVLPSTLPTDRAPRQADAVQVCLKCGFATDRRCC